MRITSVQLLTEGFPPGGECRAWPVACSMAPCRGNFLFFMLTGGEGAQTGGNSQVVGITLIPNIQSDGDACPTPEFLSFPVELLKHSVRLGDCISLSLFPIRSHLAPLPAEWDPQAGSSLTASCFSPACLPS